jgi:hypothetical protein
MNKVPIQRVEARLLPSEVNAHFHPSAEAYPHELIPLV